MKTWAVSKQSRHQPMAMVVLGLVMCLMCVSAPSFAEENRGTTWTGPNWGPEQPRFVTDLNGDGKGDLVGFGTDGVWTALGKGDGTFGKARMVLTSFNSQGWHTGQHPRFVVDLNGDGKGDIIGFGDHGVGTALSNGDGTFSWDKPVLAQFGVNHGWRGDQHPRFVVDLTGNGKADIVGFGSDGVWTALGRGDGTFTNANLVLANFGVSQGWQVAQHPRFVVDLTGDGKADIVGVSNDGVWTALGKGDGTFGPANFVLASFGVSQGWRVDKNPLFLADVTGSGRLDLVGFGDDGVWTAPGNGDGTFGNASLVLAQFGVNQGWRADQHPRLVADITGDGKADLVGFGEKGVWTAVNNGDGTFGEAKVRPDGLFGFKQGWRLEQHLRLLADLNGDGKADIIGFGNDAGPWVISSDGAGTFGQQKFALADVPNPIIPEVHHLAIPLNDLQLKLNFFLSLVHLNLDSKDHMFGKSEFTLNVAAAPDFGLKDPIQSTIELNNLNFAFYNYYFQDINSNLLTASFTPSDPVALQLTIHFETDGPVEIKVDGHTGHDIELHRFNIVFRPEITRRGNSLDLFGFVDEIEDALTHGTLKHQQQSIGRVGSIDSYWFTVQFRGNAIVQTGITAESAKEAVRDKLIERFIATDASADAGWLWDNVFRAEHKFERGINSTLYDILKTGADKSGNLYRENLNTEVKKLLGIDETSIITSVSSDGNALYIAYVVLPRP